MSDTPGIDSSRQRGAPKNLVMMLVFVLGVFVGFLASAVLNGKLPSTVKPEQETTPLAQETPPETEKPLPTSGVDEASKGQAAAPAGDGAASDREHDLVISPETRDRLMTLDF